MTATELVSILNLCVTSLCVDIYRRLYSTNIEVRDSLETKFSPQIGLQYIKNYQFFRNFKLLNPCKLTQILQQKKVVVLNLKLKITRKLCFFLFSKITRVQYYDSISPAPNGHACEQAWDSKINGEVSDVPDKVLESLLENFDPPPRK